MKKKTYILGAIVVAIFIVAGFFVVMKAQAPIDSGQSLVASNQPILAPVTKSQDMPQSQVQPVQPDKQKIIAQTVDPITGALSRITKKPFGIYITPKTSPVQPERFQGYHNAVDLETTPAEQNVDVSVKALCDGKLLVARAASGYGGVAVESCTLDGQAVTVIYGHIRLSSVTVKVGDALKAGDFLANLGTGFSVQTDGERKHLHLGIHKGTSVNILGYVQSQSELSGWIDPAKYLN